MFKKHIPTLVYRKSQQKRDWSWKETLSHWDDFWEIIWMGNFQQKRFYQSKPGYSSPGLEANRMNNQVTRTQKHLWPWCHDHSAVVLPASPHQHQAMEVTATGAAGRTAHHHHGHGHCQDKSLGTRDSAFPLSKPLLPSPLGGSEAAMGHLATLTCEPQGMRSGQGEASSLPTRTKASTANLGLSRVSWHRLPIEAFAKVVSP